MRSDGLGVLRNPRKVVRKQKLPPVKEEKEDVSFVRPSLLGGMDGLVTSFTLVIAGLLGGVGRREVLILSIASLLADGFSMASGEFVSTRSSLSITQSLLSGTACFFSFVVFGSIPLLSYFLFESTESVVLSYGVGLSLLLLFRVWSEGKKKCASLLVEVFLVGCVAGAVSAGTGIVASEIENGRA